MARPNPQTKSMISSITSRWFDKSDELSEEVLILFNADTHSYVTPSFYSTTKPQTGKVVPTWNYAAVQVYGKCKLYHRNDDSTSTFLQNLLIDLTNQQEGKMDKKAWKVADAPDGYVQALKKGIIGLEIVITRIEGRYKLSQEMGEGDWQGVVGGFKALGSRGERLAEMIEERGKPKRKVKEGDEEKKAERESE
jgi:transcriptional regulator